MKSILLIAPPSSGKGTQSMLLEREFHIPRIGASDLLRNAIESGNEKGPMIKQIMDEGRLVGAELIIDLMRERLQQPDCKNGYILDGFPRTLEQAQAYETLLEELNQPLGIVIVLELDLKTAIQRMKGRITCSNCNAIYNVDSVRPEREGYCNVCDSPLQKRNDDDESIFQKRYETYLKETQPLIQHYDLLGVTYHIDSTKSPQEVFEEICIAIGEI